MLSALDDRIATDLVTSALAGVEEGELVDTSSISAERRWAVQALNGAGVPNCVHDPIMTLGGCSRSCHTCPMASLARSKVNNSIPGRATPVRRYWPRSSFVRSMCSIRSWATSHSVDRGSWRSPGSWCPPTGPSVDVPHLRQTDMRPFVSGA